MGNLHKPKESQQKHKENLCKAFRSGTVLVEGRKTLGENVKGKTQKFLFHRENDKSRQKKHYGINHAQKNHVK